jgi:hypothetical protein
MQGEHEVGAPTRQEPLPQILHQMARPTKKPSAGQRSLVVESSDYPAAAAKASCQHCSAWASKPEADLCPKDFFDLRRSLQARKPRLYVQQ